MTPDIESLCARLMKRHSDDLKQSIEGGYDSDPIFTDAAAAIREQEVLIKALEQRCQEWSDDNEKIEDERDALRAECEGLRKERDAAREGLSAAMAWEKP